MAAYIWNANPAKWDVTPPLTSGWDALKAYVIDQSGYVYWSTPVLQNEIRVGDAAFLWRTRYRDEESGIIGIGCVEEIPRIFSVASKQQFALPQRLQAPGWSEGKAPSSWKTGIRIAKNFWNGPLRVNIRPSQGTVRRLRDVEIQAIEAEFKARIT